ncbi:hypothetical protein [Streptomyces hokutonensis]|uniref:hypothetical protein n=1 Tax=Streptomyces hokutonensis TaxID=1306990 RepID=UPI00369A53BB
MLPNESYGHMFMGYKPPTHKRDGAFQVGIETAGPGGQTPDRCKHGLTSSEKNSNPVKTLEKDWKSELAEAKTDEEQAAHYRDLIRRPGGA